MNVLILEDDKGRQITFRRNLIGTNCVVVETVKEAIDQLSNAEWDYLFLDHDLGGMQMVPSGPGTGYEVAQWLHSHPERIPAYVILHTFNPAGAANMKALLPNSVYSPGCWTKIKIR